MALFSSKPKPAAASLAGAVVPSPVQHRESTIQVNEIGRELPPCIEEAVIHYATGKTGEATAALNRHLLDHPEDRDMAPWLMLFDIHEANHHQELFEDLALDFAVRFERSPPVWAPTVDTRRAAPSDALKFQFGQIFSAVDKARLQHFLLEAGSAASVCLDFSHTPAPPPAYAKSLLDCIQHLRKLDKPIEVIGGPGFIVRLNSACSGERGDESGWLLLLAMEELMGDANGFETIALAYAIRFEISPPSFVAPKALPDTTLPLEPASDNADSFSLEGLIGSKAASRFEALEGFAVGRSRVEVDLARVTRIDFACTGQVLDTLIRLKERGCQISLKNCNTLVLALLRMIGADQYATLSLRKRT